VPPLQIDEQQSVPKPPKHAVPPNRQLQEPWMQVLLVMHWLLEVQVAPGPPQVSKPGLPAVVSQLKGAQH
jgi:hypothetical protein